MMLLPFDGRSVFFFWRNKQKQEMHSFGVCRLRRETKTNKKV